MTYIRRLDYAATPHEAYEVAPEKMLAGSPKQILSNHFSNTEGNFHTGFWEAEPGVWQVKYTEYEYCEILQGVIVMTAEDGETQTVRAGDRFTIEPGYRGTWEVLEYARKVYVIYEP
jgi:uncharacterized cupin superfamily protein